MSLPIGYRIVGGVCVFLGLFEVMASTLLTFGLFANVHLQTPNNICGAIAGGLSGVFSLIAGIGLFLNTQPAWASARRSLRYAAYSFIALVLVSIHGMFEEYKLLELAREVDRNEKRMGIVRPITHEETVQARIDLSKYPIAALAIWVLVLSETAGRLRRYLPPKQKEDLPPEEEIAPVPVSLVPDKPAES